MTTLEILIMIVAIAAATVITRFMPFILFPESRMPPKVIRYLSNMLPPAIMGMLVVYCLKDVEKTEIYNGFAFYGLKEFAAIILIIILHNRKGNVFLSIGAGTAFYIILVQALSL